MTKAQIVEQLKGKGIEANVSMPKGELLNLLNGNSSDAAGLSCTMLCNVKHNGVRYKKGEHVTLDDVTLALFKERGFVTATHDANSKPVSVTVPQTDESSVDEDSEEEEGEGDGEVADAEE